MTKLLIRSNIHNYEVNFNNDLEPLIKLKGDVNAVFIVDTKVYNIYENYFKDIEHKKIYKLDALEENKNLETVKELYRFLLEFSTKRDIHIVSIGGGIVQDLTGFIASTIYRGVHWTYFPTTLLSQSDSCIGGKTSLNFDGFKNIIGTFYPPTRIEICTNFLESLGGSELKSGIGEIIKFHLLKRPKPDSIDSIKAIVQDINNRKYLEAIHSTHLIKSDYIQNDEFDTGIRNLFNYGHCFGHAIEATSRYEVPHGIAIIMGMVLANNVSLRRMWLSRPLYEKLNHELLLPNLFGKIKQAYFEPAKIIDCLKNDKKRVGNFLTIILMRDDQLNAIKADDITELEVNQALSDVNWGVR